MTGGLLAEACCPANHLIVAESCSLLRRHFTLRALKWHRKKICRSSSRSYLALTGGVIEPLILSGLLSLSDYVLQELDYFHEATRPSL
jgi:hypothetical protein